MPYVSCKYGPPPPPEIDGMQQHIVCVDEQGREWYVPPDSQEGSWREFVANGGKVAPYEPEEPA